MPLSRGTAIALGTGVAAVGIACYVAVRYRGKESFGDDDDDAFVAPVVVVNGENAAPEKKKVERTTTTATTTATKKETGEESLARVSKTMAASSVENRLLAEALNELDLENSVETVVATTAVAGKNSVRSKSGEHKKEFPTLGLSVTLPDDWEIREDLSPFPNVAMLVLVNKDINPEDAQQQEPGSVPMIVLSVEDLRGDNVDLLEFKERCKELAVNQMLMMTGGAIQPMVTKDSPVREGPFRYALEYAQSLPPLYEIMVLNLMEVHNSVAYTFQIMCAPKLMTTFKPIFMKIAQGMRITGDIDTALGHVEVYTGVVKADMDTTWSWDYPGKKNALVTFTTSSTLKKEELSLYTDDTVPASAYKPHEEKTLDGVRIVSAYDGTQQQKMLTYNGYTLIVRPLQKSTSYLDENELVMLMKSVEPSTLPPKPKNGATFVNSEHGYQVDIVNGSRLVASRIGGGSVAYAPRKPTEEMSSDEQPPAVTIRMGTPEKDPDCMSSLSEWEARMKKEAAESDIREIKRTTINGEPCLTFISQNMEEIAPGQRMEVRGKVFIFVRDGKTILVRWEMAVGLWRKFEREMNTFVESLKLM